MGTSQGERLAEHSVRQPLRRFFLVTSKGLQLLHHVSSSICLGMALATPLSLSTSSRLHPSVIV